MKSMKKMPNIKRWKTIEKFALLRNFGKPFANTIFNFRLRVAFEDDFFVHKSTKFCVCFFPIFAATFEKIQLLLWRASKNANKSQLSFGCGWSSIKNGKHKKLQFTGQKCPRILLREEKLQQMMMIIKVKRLNDSEANTNRNAHTNTDRNTRKYSIETSNEEFACGKVSTNRQSTTHEERVRSKQMLASRKQNMKYWGSEKKNERKNQRKIRFGSVRVRV